MLQYFQQCRKPCNTTNKPVKAHDDSSSLLVCLLLHHHHSWDEIIDNPQKMGFNYLKTSMATISDQSPHELASIGIATNQFHSNKANWQLLEPSLASFQSTPIFWHILHPSVRITGISRSALLWLIAALMLIPLTATPHHVASPQNNGWSISWWVIQGEIH